MLVKSFLHKTVGKRRGMCYTIIYKNKEANTMTVEELVQQYQTDKALQDEVAAILADGKVSISEFFSFAKKHNVEVSLSDLPKYMEQAKQLGFIK